MLYTTRIHMQTQAESVISGTNAFINFLTLAHSDTRRETILTLLIIPNTRSIL